MKQIIKAIWKSNEVPTNEYFLWLKHEDKGFVLYVRGQRGWEPITSEGQISDVYTKEEIDAILEDYYKKTESDEKYLPLSAGESKPLSGTLYSRAIRPVVNGDAFGVRDESKKFTPYIFPARTFYDSARWGVKRVISCIPTDPNATTFATGVLDFVIPNVTVIKYRVTINEVYDNAKIVDTQAMMYFSNYTNMTFHSGSGLQSASGPTMEVKVAKTSDGKAHLLIGDVSKTYATLTIIEVEVISTAGVTETIDTIYNKLNPTFVTDLSDYTTVATLVSLDY